MTTYTVRYERVRGFQPPWYTVKVYTCQCGQVTRLRQNWHGSPPRGAILCSACGNQLNLDR